MSTAVATSSSTSPTASTARRSSAWSLSRIARGSRVSMSAVRGLFPSVGSRERSTLTRSVPGRSAVDPDPSGEVEYVDLGGSLDAKRGASGLADRDPVEGIPCGLLGDPRDRVLGLLQEHGRHYCEGL